MLDLIAREGALEGLGRSGDAKALRREAREARRARGPIAGTIGTGGGRSSARYHSAGPTDGVASALAPSRPASVYWGRKSWARHRDLCVLVSSLAAASPGSPRSTTTSVGSFTFAVASLTLEITRSLGVTAKACEAAQRWISSEPTSREFEPRAGSLSDRSARRPVFSRHASSGCQWSLARGPACAPVHFAVEVLRSRTCSRADPDTALPSLPPTETPPT